MKSTLFPFVLTLFLFAASPAWGLSEAFSGKIYEPGRLKPIDSKTHLKVGYKAPDFTLPAVQGGYVSLKDFRGKKNVVLSFIPAAWTPVCSDQWPGYNIVKDIFEENDAVLLGISVDNIPTLFAWTKEMGNLWFPVLSDFYPHGRVAARYGILRTDGMAERAIVIIDKKGMIRFFHVSDINKRPALEMIVQQLEKLKDR
ncbi:MAG TPA: peroxiredoxin [Syntrophales bacterium]|nr:peroxiredoxin [Syntrophales bacterium]HOL58779.1 peroxiredoxin [Syntrophales bacterium]HPO35106.1 peroxiredoxin [Syntrophales bacterium]